MGEDASLVMGSVEDPRQFGLGGALVAGDKLARNVGRQAGLEEIQRETDAFSIGGCHSVFSLIPFLGTALLASLQMR